MMSGAALFGNNGSRNNLKNLVEFKAGKMTMKGKMVYPDTRKGQLYVYQSNDSLMHLCWKDRTTGFVEDDLIIFPDDCEFKHVPQCKTGRVYVLRFKASDKKFFVWLQSLKTDKDEENCRKINEVLNDLPTTPDTQRSGNPNVEGDLQNLLNNMSQQQLIQLFGGVGQMGGISNLLGTMTRPQVTQSARTSTTTASSDSTRNTISRPATQMTSSPSSTNDTSMSSNSESKPAPKTPAPSTQGTTTTTRSSNRSLFSDFENFTSGIPPVLPVPPVLSVPPISLVPRVSPIGSEILVQSGQAGPVIQQFGLGPDAVNAAASGNIEEFVSALETEAKTGQEQTQQGQDNTSAKQASPTASADKKDDDEGMALD